MWLLGLAGAALFTFLLVRQGAPQVGAAFASAGWAIAGVVIYHLVVPVLLDALAWWALFPKPERLSLWQLFWMRWIGESVSTLGHRRACLLSRHSGRGWRRSVVRQYQPRRRAFSSTSHWAFLSRSVLRCWDSA